MSELISQLLPFLMMNKEALVTRQVKVSNDRHNPHDDQRPQRYNEIVLKLLSIPIHSKSPQCEYNNGKLPYSIQRYAHNALYRVLLETLLNQFKLMQN